MAGASGDDSDDEFSRALECPIHFGVIQQPKALACQHTFCRDCLEQLVSGSQIMCPICRMTCLLSVNGVDDLPNNITVQNILDTLCVSCHRTHIKTTCPCCQKQLCDRCKIKHASGIQSKITGKKHHLTNMVGVLTTTRQSLDQSKIGFLSQAAFVKSEVKFYIISTIERLKRRGAQLEAELNSLIETETKRNEQCQENIKKHEHEIQVALQNLAADDTATLENLEKLSENISALLSNMAVSPATVSCKLGGQDAVHDLVQISYKPPQPGSGAPTDLQQSQPVTIDYQAIGKPREVFGQKGSGPGQFNCHSHLDVFPDSGNLVVCDTDNNRVQVFTADGTFLRMFGSKGQGKGQFNFGESILSGGVTVTDGGEIVIADTENHRLQVFDKVGEFTKVIGSEGSSPGMFNCPIGVTCDRSDHLYICDRNNRRVQVMTMDGSVARVIPGSDVPGGDWWPVDIAVCPDGDLVVADWGTGLQVFSARGQHKATIRCGEGQDVECKLSAGVAVDPQGNILVTDGFGTDRVYVVEKSGKLVCSFGGKGSSPGEFKCPVGIAVTQHGHIIVADYGNHRIQIF